MLREACGNLLIPYSLIAVALPSLLHQLTVAWESLRNSPSPYLVEMLKARLCPFPACPAVSISSEDFCNKISSPEVRMQ